MTDTTTSAALFQPAVKEKLKARVALDGPTGSGKTWTALQWARILVGADGPIGVIDTENRSAAYYAPSPGQLAGTEPIERLQFWDPPYTFGHMVWSPPYDPIRLTQVIKVAGQQLGEHGCLVVDSFSHFWEGEGGTLDLVDAAGQRAQGNRFAGWKEGTPAQRAMLDAIIHAPCHVICCMRSKMEYVLEEVTEKGRTFTRPKKIGMRPIQREGVEYEFTLIADMDLEHRLIVSKSRCSLVSDVVATKGHSHEAAVQFAAWLDSGVERITAEQVTALVEALNSVKDEQSRIGLKRGFIDAFGPPQEVTTDRVGEVVEWVTNRVSRLNGDEQPTPPAVGEEAGEPEDVPRGTSAEQPPAADPPADAPAEAPAASAPRGRGSRSRPAMGADSAETPQGHTEPPADGPLDLSLDLLADATAIVLGGGDEAES